MRRRPHDIHWCLLKLTPRNTLLRSDYAIRLSTYAGLGTIVVALFPTSRTRADDVPLSPLQDLLGAGQPEGWRRQAGLGAVCLYVAVVAATFVFFYPVLTGRPLSHSDWLLRMWFPSWF